MADLNKALNRESLDRQDLNILRNLVLSTKSIVEGTQFCEEIDELDVLTEALSGTDWNKMGAALGLLWFKFDRVIDGLKRIEDVNRGIRDNTRRR